MLNDRRSFLKTAGSSALFASLGSSFFTSCYEKEDDLTQINSIWENGYNIYNNIIKIDLKHYNFKILNNQGGWKRFDEGGLLIVNVGSDIIRAFTSICPHAQCSTSWEFKNDNFICTCHNAIFKNDGSIVSGPAKEDLKSFATKLEDNILTITKD